MLVQIRIDGLKHVLGCACHVVPIEAKDAPTQRTESVVTPTVTTLGELTRVKDRAIELDRDPSRGICEVDTHNRAVAQADLELRNGLGPSCRSN
jgi:hypothetical protein